MIFLVVVCLLGKRTEQLNDRKLHAAIYCFSFPVGYCILPLLLLLPPRVHWFTSWWHRAAAGFKDVE